MDKKDTVKEFYSIDFLHIVRSLWHRAWIIITACIICGGIGFSYSYFYISPTYSSSIMMYVNNSGINVGDIGLSISASQLSAAQSLTKTYSVLLKNRTTLERVVDNVKLGYDWEQLDDMISASPVAETEVMRITVTCGDPYHAEKIANGIAEVLPGRISEIIEGSNMEVVDYAVANPNKVAPSISKYTALGMILGVFISVLVLSIVTLMDDTIHDDDYITENFDYPILAKVPNLLDSGNKKHNYYKYYKREYGSFKKE